MTSHALTPESQQRAAVVDLGSNSVRMVVFEGVARNPVPIFNEKSTLRLGKGLEATGRLSEEGISKAMEVLSRYGTIAQAMGATPFDVLATAAVRDAHNGMDFIEAAQKRVPNAHFRILKGTEEADYSACGVLCAVPDADGLVADIGGGSLELIRVQDGHYSDADSTPLGVIRLRERSDGDLATAQNLAKHAFANVKWLPEARKRPLYLVGGAFRALARLHIARMQYPLNMVHLYHLSYEEAYEMASWTVSASRKQIEKIGNVPRKRLVDAPFAAAALLRLLKHVQPSDVWFSAEGLREGWYMGTVASSVKQQDPMEALASEMASRLGRNASLPEALISWTAPLFLEHEEWSKSENEVSLHRLACMVSDIGSYDHPQYRAEQTYRRLLYSHGVGFDHKSRAFSALVIAVRYEIDLEHPVLEPSRVLLSKSWFSKAVQLGMALRLAYTLCAGTDILLKSCQLRVEGETLILDMGAGSLRAAGSAVKRRFERLADALNMTPHVKGG